LKKLIALFLAVILFQFVFVFVSCKKAEESLEPSIIYSNTDYGFEVELPADWEGYSIIEDTWTGDIYGEEYPEGREYVTVTGPKMLIRYPLSSEASKLDVAIMILNLSEWEKVDFMAGAPAVELGRNSKYVFALPVRYYNYEGFEEIRDIIYTKIKANENIK